MSEEQTKFTWSLGDDSDCDTCGWSYNELGLELWDEEEGVWQLYISVGCYSGQGVLSSEEDWDSKVAEIIKDALNYSGFTKSDAKKLQKKIALIKGENR